MVTAAEKILARDGVDGLTTNRIAELAGVSVGSLYQYFPDKAAIVSALIDRYIEQFYTAFVATLTAARNVPVAEVIERASLAIIGALRGQASVHVALFEHISARGMQRLYAQNLERFAEAVEGFLRTHDGVKIAQPTAAAFVIVHAVEGGLRAISTIATDDAVVETRRRELCQMLVRYLTA
jgi:AcrR family transcriptional regulator